jgi:hypothetical protein
MSTTKHSLEDFNRYVKDRADGIEWSVWFSVEADVDQDSESCVVELMNIYSVIVEDKDGENARHFESFDDLYTFLDHKDLDSMKEKAKEAIVEELAQEEWNY